MTSKDIKRAALVLSSTIVVIVVFIAGILLGRRQEAHRADAMWASLASRLPTPSPRTTVKIPQVDHRAFRSLRFKTKVVDQAKSQTVKVYAETYASAEAHGENSGESLGSGVFLGWMKLPAKQVDGNTLAAVIVTAGHVVHGTTGLHVLFPHTDALYPAWTLRDGLNGLSRDDSPSGIHASVRIEAPAEDVALVAVPMSQAAANELQLTGASLKPPSVISKSAFVFGYHHVTWDASAPRGKPALVQHGIYYQIVEKWPRTTWLYCPGCGHGDSGGGVFGENGALFGVLVAGGSRDVEPFEPFQPIDMHGSKNPRQHAPRLAFVEDAGLELFQDARSICAMLWDVALEDNQVSKDCSPALLAGGHGDSSTPVTAE